MLANAFVLAVVLNQVAALFPVRADLTEEKRYTVKPQTIALLQSLQEDVFVEVFLEGDLNPGFRRFQKSIREMLDEFTIRSNGRVKFTFTDPGTATSAEARNTFMTGLMERGLAPLNIIDNKDGQQSQKIVFPGALITYGGAETAVNLLKNNSARGSQVALNQSIETLEFELVAGISRLVRQDVPKVGWITGHGEAEGPSVASVLSALREQVDVTEVDLPAVTAINGPDLVIIARPVNSWSDADLYKLDQFVMRGGRVMVFIDNIDADMRQASEPDYYPAMISHGLDGLLFRYGARINPDLVQDAVALPYPVVTGTVAGKSQFTPMEWPFFPLVSRYADHPATRNLDASLFRFVSTIDTIGSGASSKLPLMLTSPYTRTLTAPVKVGIDDLRNGVDPKLFTGGQKITGLLLEGNFTSLFKNRFKPEGTGARPMLEQGSSRVVVISDGDFLLNDVDGRDGKPMPLGFDKMTGQTFANKEVILNLAAWLADKQGIINARSRTVTLRPLDKNLIREERLYWQLLNLGLPVGLMAVIGIGLAWWRKKRFTGFNNK
ncbi:MAG: gliding motility-associated ABC transporter substrate-binding protein GldG [Bacteroidota bacterium]